MKKILTTLILLASLGTTHAQTWDEMFRQKETQKAYLEEQIFFLKSQSRLFREGYSLVSQGLQTLQDIQGGERELHRLFFRSRQEIPPALEAEALEAEAAGLVRAISLRFRQSLSLNLSPAHHTYVRQVQESFQAACAREMAELKRITTTGPLEMEEAERLRLSLLVLSSLRQRHVRTVLFTQQVHLQSLRQKQAHRELERLRPLLQ